MCKRRHASLLVVCMLLLTTIPVIAHGRSSVTMGQLHDDDDEKLLQHDITEQIIINSSNTFYENTYNWFPEDTTIQNIHSAAEGVGESESIVFYIGHGIKEGWYDPPKYYIHTGDGNDYPVYADNSVGDYTDGIYPNTPSYPNPKFVFLWSCWQGNETGYYDFDAGRAVGMPFAILRDSDLSEDGYDNPDGSGHAFIGFEEPAYWLQGEIWDVDQAGYEFLSTFYELALDLDKSFTVNGALAEATSLVWHHLDDFDDNPFRLRLYGSIVVYGDGNILISPKPSGGGGGSPYPPNLPTGYLSNPSNLLIDNRR